MHRLVDRGLADSPATDWSVILPGEWLERLPLGSDKLWRPDDAGRPGYYRAPVYRDCELVPMPLTKPILILTDAAGDRPSLYMNTGTGQIGHSMIEVGLTHPDADRRI